jgi:hypothetical protein
VGVLWGWESFCFLGWGWDVVVVAMAAGELAVVSMGSVAILFVSLLFWSLVVGEFWSVGDCGCSGSPML